MRVGRWWVNACANTRGGGGGGIRQMLYFCINHVLQNCFFQFEIIILHTSACDVHRRQILTSKVGRRIEKIELTYFLVVEYLPSDRPRETFVSLCILCTLLPVDKTMCYLWPVL